MIYREGCLEREKGIEPSTSCLEGSASGSFWEFWDEVERERWRLWSTSENMWSVSDRPNPFPGHLRSRSLDRAPAIAPLPELYDLYEPFTRLLNPDERDSTRGERGQRTSLH